MFRSVRAKFTFWYIGSFFVLLLLSFGVTDFIFHQVALESIDNGLYDGVKRLEQALPTCFSNDWYEQKERFNDCFDKQLRKLFTTEIILAQLTDFPENGETTILAKSYTLQEKTFPFSQAAYQAIKNNTPLFETVGKPDFTFATEIRLLTLLITINNARPYILQFGTILGEEEKFISGSQNPLAARPHIFIVVFPILLIIITYLGYFFMKKAFAPIHKIVTLAKNITAEDLSHRIESVKSSDEIGELADTFNEMIARLEHSFKQIRQFSGDVAHELKTPLTVIKGEIEVALRKERKTEEYHDILTSLAEETEKLRTIVEDLLFLSRMDAHSIPLSFTELSLDELLLEVYEDSYRLAERKQVALSLRNVESVKIMGDAGLLKRLFSNLILNAIRYTPAGGKVELFLRQNPDTAVWTITDTGIGIPEDQLQYIFDRFYRVDRSRSHETGGSGLGLAIVQKIVEAHEGKIEVTSEVGKGTTFRILLNRES
jgi:signal transduction histidine kinase